MAKNKKKIDQVVFTVDRTNGKSGLGTRVVTTCLAITKLGTPLSGVAICSPGDEYNSEAGHNKAFSRAIEPLDLSRKRRVKLHKKYCG